jgi:hypothetical protein
MILLGVFSISSSLNATIPANSRSHDYEKTRIDPRVPIKSRTDLPHEAKIEESDNDREARMVNEKRARDAKNAKQDHIDLEKRHTKDIEHTKEALMKSWKVEDAKKKDEEAKKKTAEEGKTGVKSEDKAKDGDAKKEEAKEEKKAEAKEEKKADAKEEKADAKDAKEEKKEDAKEEKKADAKEEKKADAKEESGIEVG